MNRDTRSNLILILLMGFVSAWTYTEIREAVERDDFYVEVHKFMYEGDRFTQQEGDDLTSRLEALENKETAP